MNNLRITIKNPKGMENGITVTMTNRGKTIEEFKKDHLERYDRAKFYETFNPPEPEPEAPKYQHIITPDQFNMAI